MINPCRQSLIGRIYSTQALADSVDSSTKSFWQRVFPGTMRDLLSKSDWRFSWHSESPQHSHLALASYRSSS